MMKMRKIIAVFIIAVLLIGAFAAFVSADENVVGGKATTDEAMKLMEEPDNPETAGNCGENLSWLYSDGVLTITGSGDMIDYSEGTTPPWDAFSEEIIRVDFGEGITSIGEQAFANCTAITNVYFEGTADIWATIIIDAGNNAIAQANLHCKEILNGWIQADEKWFYYIDNDLVTGWKLIDNHYYYFNESGVMQKGWIQDKDSWYFLNDSGAMQIGWKEIDGKWYYFRTSGSMVTGWIQDGHNWYFLNDSGTIQIGWKKIDGKWYYFWTSGSMATGWIQDGNSWYFLKDSGTMMTGWLSRNGKWYYLNPSGAMQTAWKKINDNWYYFSDSGAMCTGWVLDGALWYYLDTSGSMITGWKKIGGVWYLFMSNGHMLDENDMLNMAKKTLDKTGWNLEEAYKWSVNLKYEKEAYSNTTITCALHSFESGYGDCIGCAATFCWMARALGYECKVLYGEVPYASGGYGEHAWCEIVVSGKTYWVDPSFARQTGRNGYLFNYGQSGTWVYRNWYTMKD